MARVPMPLGHMSHASICMSTMLLFRQAMPKQDFPAAQLPQGSKKSLLQKEVKYYFIPLLTVRWTSSVLRWEWNPEVDYLSRHRVPGEDTSSDKWVWFGKILVDWFNYSQCSIMECTAKQMRHIWHHLGARFNPCTLINMFPLGHIIVGYVDDTQIYLALSPMTSVP